MSESPGIGVPKWYWAVAGLALLWYLFGFFVYYSSVTTSAEQYQEWVMFGKYTQGYVDYMLAIPSWVTAAFAIATTSGVLGCICLLMRRAWAKPLLIVALVSALLMYIYAFVLSGRAADLPPFDFIIAALVVGIAAFLIWFSRMSTGKSWLK